MASVKRKKPFGGRVSILKMGQGPLICAERRETGMHQRGKMDGREGKRKREKRKEEREKIRRGYCGGFCIMKKNGGKAWRAEAQGDTRNERKEVCVLAGGPDSQRTLTALSGGQVERERKGWGSIW